MNAIVQFQDGTGLTVREFSHWEFDKDTSRYTFYKNGDERPFLDAPRDKVSWILDEAELEPRVDEQKALNAADTPQPMRDAALEQSKLEAARFVLKEHPQFLELIDQRHEVESLRVYKPTDAKRKTLAAVCEAAASYPPYEDEDANVALTMKFRDLETQPSFTMPKSRFGEKMAAGKDMRPVVSPLVQFNGEQYRAAISKDGETVQLFRCGVESSGKVGLQTTSLPVRVER